MANREIKIGEYVISDDSVPFFIAEIGINHNGDVQLAKKMIDAAFATGWNCVKFQKREPQISVPDSQKNVLKDTPWGQMTYIQYKELIEFGKKEYNIINKYCADKPILWTASPWDMPSLDFLLEREFNLPFIKIASASNGNEELIRTACKTGKPIIISAGMCTQKELDKTVSWLEDYSNGDYILLHTNSTYPSPADKLNLKYMCTMRERYNCLVGYSGHEQNLEPTVVAVSFGAKVIERHITLSHEMWGTDQKASLEINAMYLLIRRCLGICESLGTGEKTMDDDEMSVRLKLRGN